MRILNALIITACATMATPAPAHAASTVTLWHAYRGKERAALEKVANAFNAKQSGISLKLLAIPYDAFPDKITASIPRGKGPDLFIFAHDRIGGWAASEHIEPLGFWVDDELLEKFVDPTVSAMEYDDALYGLPIAYKMLVLFYNKKLVKTPPKTTAELVKIAQSHTDVPNKKFGLVYENANFYYQGVWFQGFGARVFDRKGKPTLDSAPSVASMRYAQKLAHESGIMPEEVTSTLVTTLFNRGHAALVINGSWFLGEIDGVDFGVAPLPTIDEASGKPAMPFLTSEAIIMSANATGKKEAFEVMKYLTSPEAAIVLALDGRMPVARKEAYEDPRVAKDPQLSVFRTQLKSSIPTPNTPAMRMVWTPVTTAMFKVINGKRDPQEAMSKAQAEVVELVKGARR